MNPWRSTATALTLFIWPGPIPPYLIHNVISFCASHPLGFHRSAEQKCPEGAKACSLGLALFASPRSTTTHNTQSPEGATAVRWSSSQWRSSMRVMKHLLFELRTRRGSRKKLPSPLRDLRVSEDRRLPGAGKKRQPQATCLSSFGAKPRGACAMSRRELAERLLHKADQDTTVFEKLRPDPD